MISRRLKWRLLFFQQLKVGQPRRVIAINFPDLNTMDA
jgi:hypothetical protein